MIGSFLETWGMFRDTYLTAVFSGLLLASVGVLVVAQGQVFLAVAVAQASMLGVAVSLASGWGPPWVLAVGFSVGAALLTAGSRARDAHRREETAAWVFLVASSLTILLLAHQALGMKQVQALLASSLIGATPGDALLYGVLAAASMVTLLVLRARLVLYLGDPVMAAAVGIPIAVWSLAIATALGLVTGLSIHTSGLLFTFGCLTLPALVARQWCRRASTLFLLAPAVCGLALVPGLVLAHAWDYPPGQVIVALLAGMLWLAWGGRWLMSRMENGGAA